jgi:hypothetical protein
MYPAPPLHTHVSRLIQADRMREVERKAALAAALDGREGADEVQGVFSRLALVPAARLASRLSSRKPAGGVA